MDNMTALVSAFARAHHYKNNEEWVFADRLAEKMPPKRRRCSSGSTTVQTLTTP